MVLSIAKSKYMSWRYTDQGEIGSLAHGLLKKELLTIYKYRKDKFIGWQLWKTWKKNCIHWTRVIDELWFSELPSNKKVTLAHLYIYFSKYATYGPRPWIKRCAIQWTKLFISKIDTKCQFRCTTADKKKTHTKKPQDQLIINPGHALRAQKSTRAFIMSFC